MTTIARRSPAASVDAVTFEVIRHRLMGITDEQSARLTTTSGSKHVTEMSDYNVGLYLEDGSVAAMGRTVLHHAATMAALCRSVIADCSENPGIAAGDTFIVNDPWKGSVHAPDMALMTPIFVDDELLFWAGAMMHMSDIGGMYEGSVMLPATDAFQEGLLLPPLKLVDRGVMREDLWRMILGSCRHPSTMSLDLKGLLAANMAAVEGLTQLARRYSVETLRNVMAVLVKSSESRLRDRLRELPDATITASGFLEYEPSFGDVPVVHLEMTKTGDRLMFDFSKSSPQVANSTNCTYGGLMAGLAGALLPTLAYDIPWNAGIFNVLEVTCPEGLICNARRPAAVSGNISGAVWEVDMAATVALSRLAACSDTYLREAQSSSCGRPGSLFFYGQNQHNERFSGRTFDVLASGGGAYADHDGVSSHGHHGIVRAQISNVEALELDMPILYLRRGWAADSGGAGRRRGGSSVVGVYKPHQSHPTFQRIGRTWHVPDAMGLFGGYPGAEMGSVLLRNSDVEATLAGGHVPMFDEIKGERYVSPQPPPQTIVLGPGDVVRADPPAGAGWGDPLDRTLDDITIDLEDDAITPDAAVRFFGCVLDANGCVDRAATGERRDALRAERTRWTVREKRTAQPQGALVRCTRLGDQLEIRRDAAGAFWTVCRCGSVLAPAAENWRRYAAYTVAAGAELGPALVVHQRLEARRYACPDCGVLHSADICRKDDPDPHDIRLDLSVLEPSVNAG
jgi:N-methylhydantoinase B